MAPLSDAETREELRDELDELAQIEEELYEEERKRERRSLFTGWGLSLLIHTFVLLLLSVVFITRALIVEDPPVRVALIDTPPPPPDERIKDDIVFDEPIVFHEEVVTDDVTLDVTLEDVVVEEVKITTEDPEPQNEAQGRENALSTSEMGASAFFNNIGASGGAAGKWGRQKGGDKAAMRRAFGPNAKRVSESIDFGLRWLMRHQSPDGRWDSDMYWVNCDDQPKCEPGKNVGGADEAMTGYALLSFLALGYDHRVPSRYRKTVQKGLEWILDNQQENGLIGKRNYEHPVATMALAEAYAMTADPNLREPTQKAVNVILDRQAKDGEEDYARLGWDYIKPKITRNDTSVTGWAVFALKSAKTAGIDVGEGLNGSKRWLEGAWKAANPNWKTLNDPYTDKSVFPYTWNAENDQTKKDHLSFVGGLVGVFLEIDTNDIMKQTMANDVMDRWIRNGRWKNNFYSTYYSSMFIFQMSGERWKEMANIYAPDLANSIIKDPKRGCNVGTWDFEKQNWHGGDTSQVLIHTYAVLSLAVAVRYGLIKQN